MAAPIDTPVIQLDLGQEVQNATLAVGPEKPREEFYSDLYVRRPLYDASHPAQRSQFIAFDVQLGAIDHKVLGHNVVDPNERDIDKSQFAVVALGPFRQRTPADSGE